MALYKFNLTILICLLFFCNYIKGQDDEEFFEGSPCRTKDDRQGACVKLTECEEIDYGLRRGLIPYSSLTRCLFIGDMEVICCPGRTPTVTTPSNRPDRIDTDTIIFDYFSKRNLPSSSSTERTTTLPSSTSSSLSGERIINVNKIQITDKHEFIDLTKLLRPNVTRTTIKPNGNSMPIVNSPLIFPTTQKPWWNSLVDDKMKNQKIVSTTTTTKTPEFHGREWIWFDSTTERVNNNFDKPPSKPPKSIDSNKNERNHQNVFWPSPSTQKPRNSKSQTNTEKSVIIVQPNNLNWLEKTTENIWKPFIFPSNPNTEPNPIDTINPNPVIDINSSHKVISNNTVLDPWMLNVLNAFPTSTTIKSVINNTVLDPWMLDVLNSKSSTTILPDLNKSILDSWMIEALKNVSTSTPATTSSSTVIQRLPESNFNPDDYNDVSPSPPNPRVDNDNTKGEKSKAACARYSKDVTAGLTFHILNGIPTVPGEFPHMAALGYPSLGGGEDLLWDCGGSLISERFVLTAAHCGRVDRQPTIVRLGKITLVTTDDNLDAVDITVSEVILHPEYRASRQYNDIALLKLSQIVEFNEYIRPACLYTETADVDPNVQVIVTGWGSTSTKSRVKSQFLLKVNLTTVPVDQCNQSHVEYGLNRRYPSGLNDGQLCAFDPGLEKDACEGDSGGPLQLVDKNGISTVVGVTSFGISCATSIPGVYARVAFYLQWIESVVW